STMQQRLIPILHYGLKTDGFLLLGASESVGPFRGLFELIDSKHKLYTRKAGPVLLTGFIHPEARGDGERVPEVLPKPQERGGEIVLAGADPQREADRLMLARYVPAGVLINSEMDILQFRGDTAPYLAPSPGRASLNLLKMLKDGLAVGVRAAV